MINDSRADGLTDKQRWFYVTLRGSDYNKAYEMESLCNDKSFPLTWNYTREMAEKE